MSHKKVNSNGSIPFSWEDKPGVRKAPKPNHDYFNITGIGSSVENLPRKSSSTLPLPPPPTSSLVDSSSKIPAIEGMKIPQPPCASRPSLTSTSGKGFRWQQDPFLVAYKECTKLESMDKFPCHKKKGVGSNNSRARKSRFIFSCKNSRDARDDNFLKLSQLPSLHP